jgi:hypothetical protein
MEIRQRLYFVLSTENLYILTALMVLTFKVRLLYLSLLPVYCILLAIHWRLLHTQSVFGLKCMQWLRILQLFAYGICLVSGVIVITTYHYGAWDSLQQQSEHIYHQVEKRFEIQLVTALSAVKFLFELWICSLQNDLIEMLEFKRLYRMQ